MLMAFMRKEGRNKNNNNNSSSSNNNNRSLGEILNSPIASNDSAPLFSHVLGCWAEEVEKTRGPLEADIPSLCMPLYVETPETLGPVPTETPPFPFLQITKQRWKNPRRASLTRGLNSNKRCIL